MKPFAVAVIGASLVLGACGDDAGVDMSDVATSSSFAVVATEMAFTPARVAVPAGPVSVTVDNQGSILHDLHIEQQPFLIEVGAGESGSGEVTLEAGQYNFFCGIPGHRAAGMEGVLEVR